MDKTGESILRIDSITMRFGGITAVNQLNFAITPGSITALIGPNGAGKTTVFNMLTGVYTPTEGQIYFKNKKITGLKPFEITKLGIARTFQNIRLFKNLTVLDNIRIAADIQHTNGLTPCLLRTEKFQRYEKETVKKCYDLLQVFDLDKRALELAKNLPYGDQRRLEIARALATGANLLLLDEPAAGMNHQETKELMSTLTRLKKDFRSAYGPLTLFLIEHDMKLVMGISEKIIVLDYGQKIAEDLPEHIQKNPKVIEAYLGKAKTKPPQSGNALPRSSDDSSLKSSSATFTKAGVPV